MKDLEELCKESTIMIFYNYSDEEFKIIYDAINALNRGSQKIDFQSLFSHDKKFLTDIASTINMTLYARNFFEYLNLNDASQLYNFNAHEIKNIVKILQEIFEYMHDVIHYSKVDIASSEFKLTQKKLEEFLSEMVIDNLSDDQVFLMNYFFDEFFQELRVIFSKTRGQLFLENILLDMQNILKNQEVVNNWGGCDFISRLSFHRDQINVILKVLKIAPRYVDCPCCDTVIEETCLEINTLIVKIEHWLLEMKFNVISDDNLNVIYNIINEFIKNERKPSRPFKARDESSQLGGI
ncbi:MAG: hypothetical protein JO129_03890 [Candidatus Dependentiae bacterium]|nr:hypothetical protein [Candidatus Dependentiae bacterium]